MSYKILIAFVKTNKKIQIYRYTYSLHSKDIFKNWQEIQMIQAGDQLLPKT